MVLCQEAYKPSKSLLKSSFRRRFKEYPKIAAIHGIEYVADSNRPRVERIGWFFCIVVSTVLTIWIIITLMEKFQTDPMMDSMEIKFDNTLFDLPQFYICPPWDLFKNMNILLEGSDYEFYKNIYEWDFINLNKQNSSNYIIDNFDDTVTSLKELFIQNAPSCDELIDDSILTSNAVKTFNSSLFKLDITTAGICCVLQSMESIVEAISVTFDFNIIAFPTNVYVTLDNKTKPLRHLNLFKFRAPLALSISLQETTTSPAAKYLTKSQRGCYFPGEQSPYIECVLNTIIKNSFKYCNCVPWYLVVKDDMKECRISEYYGCLANYSKNILKVEKHICRQSCDNVLPTTNYISISRINNYSRIEIKPRSTFKFKRIVRFGWADLFVSFGGIAGLFLGSSLVSIIELGYYFSLRTYCGAVLKSQKPKSKPKSKSRNKSIIKINVSDNLIIRADKTTFSSSLSKKSFTFYDYVN